MPEKTGRLKEVIDWARRFHWIWTIFPASWKAFVVGSAVAGIAGLLAYRNTLTAAHWWIFFLVALAIYSIAWTKLQKHRLPYEPDGQELASQPELGPVIGVSANDPRIYLDIKPASDQLPRTPFILINEGKEIAHRVSIDSFQLDRKPVRFPITETIAAGGSSEVIPTIENADGLLSKHDIFQWLMEDYNAAGEGTEEWSIPLTIRYSDFSKTKRFLSTMSLAFYPDNYAAKQIHSEWKSVGAAWEIKNIEFTRVADSKPEPELSPPDLRPLVVPVSYGKIESPPKVVPVRWDRSPDGHHGLIVRNDGEPAFDISVGSLSVGTSHLEFWDRVYPGLTKADGELCIDSNIRLLNGSGTTGNALRNQMVEADLEQITLAIKYRDFEGAEYTTTFELNREVWGSGLRVGSVRQIQILRS
jgi:hypothetical protein